MAGQRQRLTNNLFPQAGVGPRELVTVDCSKNDSFVGLLPAMLKSDSCGSCIRYFDRDVECIFKFFGKRYVDATL
jgi:hypothetical protein